MNIHDMLIAYQAINKKRLIEAHRMFGDLTSQQITQVIQPPQPLTQLGMATLQQGHYRPLSPMLKARFEYAGSWKEADAGHEWLDLTQIEECLRDQRVLKQIRERIQVWNESSLAKLPPSRISLFGLYRDQSEEIYLIWPNENGTEPKVLSYAGNFEAEFTNLGHYLKHLIDG